ncbi:lytic transglycosylase domain-containing protein [Nioella aestuarii]|uniref:lytic transglycosylase domain-containing protein n=1 Tax=Nioella aestuarii TaxID=1662864 RepID=UPI003D7F3362
MAQRELILAACVAASVMTGAGVQAQDETEQVAPPPFPEFTFRRITVPTPGQTGPRINIQIGDRPAEPAVETTAITPVPQGANAADWFWDEIPAGRDFSAGRYQSVMQLLSTAPEAGSLPIARAETLLAMAEAHGPRILQETIGTSVSPALVLAVMAVESLGDTSAESGAGAQGLMQLIPATAARFGVTDAFDADQNIAGGVAYLDWLMDEFDRDPVLVLAGYNAGEGAVRGANGVPDFRETRDYVPRVMATWMLARALCVTPPELVSDGCVFRTMVASSG